MHPHKKMTIPLSARSGPIRNRAVTVLLTFAAALLAACQPGPRTLTVMTHDSFAVSESLLEEFERENGVQVSILLSGDAGEMVNKAILTKQAPLADVLYGVDNTFLSRALGEDLFEPYDAPWLGSIPAAFQLDAGHRVIPVDYGDVCINYDVDFFQRNALPIPDSLEDLADPVYRGMLVVENPATSSTGLAFLLATVKHFGPDGYAGYWTSLRKNGVQVADGWTTAYYTNFSGASGKGSQPMVVSYASSPPAEMVFADPVPLEPPTASLTGPDMCFRQVEFAGILSGTPNRILAERFIDFLLGKVFQEGIPLMMYMFPVHPEAVLPDAFVRYAQIPDQPATLPPDEITAHREEWIAVWNQTVVR